VSKRVTSGETTGIEELKKHRRAAAVLGFGGAIAGQSRRQRIHHQCKAKALVAELGAAEREDAAGWIREQDLGVIGRIAEMIDQPLAGELLAPPMMQCSAPQR